MTYNEATSRWVVELPRFQGKTLEVLEDTIIFGFTVLPSNATRVQRHATLLPVSTTLGVSQGGCGRGLVLGGESPVPAQPCVGSSQ